MLRILIFSILFFSNIGFLQSHVIYHDRHDKYVDYGTLPVEVLTSKKGVKYEYLLALHKVYSESDKREIEEGINELRKLAELDIVDAKHSLYEISGWANIDGLTSVEALTYLKEAAREGYSYSQVELAREYYNGSFGEKDAIRSHYWLVEAAQQGSKEGMLYLSGDYFMGRGVVKNDEKGFNWLMIAYEKLGRNFDDWRRLGQAYETGRGTPINLVKAYMCYDLLGTAGIELKQRIAPRMTADERAEGLRLSSEWQEKNHVYTMQHLGLKRHQDGSYR